ncbi:2'-5' RNA ligase family protein [Legionella sp. MW5194]|uniref:2'-5' RNA ligase family protein n=1 Tax=Legionella sp. MW5194 TaxID=2662448 RepID=UPI00193DB79A|nr:2'-5' RNA ligase family protein [Legionella sp. MW5194]
MMKTHYAHSLLQRLIGLTLILLIPHAFGRSVNVYVELDNLAVYQSIEQFNQFLKSKGVFKKYQIEPFLHAYPLHVTLYLADYPDKNIPQLVKRVAFLAKFWHAVELKTTSLYVTKGNYVMLGIDLPHATQGGNSYLQQMSDETVLQLNSLRDTNTPIPDWAMNNAVKRQAFSLYGSPNVFFEYTPHITLMAKPFKNTSEAAAFQEEMNALIKDYRQLKPLQFKVSAIGIGYADALGQITQPFAHFKLSLRTKEKPRV